MTMAALRGQLRALSNDRDLRRFVVQATPTGVHLGTGSYGSVEEVIVNGLLCAGKRIHEILLDAGNVGVREIAAKYVQECQLMSNLRHPNVTLFIGVCFLPNCQLPLLVMERLDGSLDDLLETVPNIPLALKRSFLEDTARGLLYLHKHNPQIIHRDLTAKNVLLTSSLVAKITDLGNSRIVNIQPGQLAQTLSRNPGTLVYMPPEALTVASRYGPSLDIFSFGHLGIFVGLQVFPGDLLEPTYTDQGSLLARSEVERRRNYIDQLNYKLPKNGQHPFVQLVMRCLQNEALQRPTAEELVTSLVEMKADIEGPYGEVAKADAVRQVVMMRALKKRDTEVREKSDESAAKDVEIHQLQEELEHEQAERTRAEEQLQQKTTELDSVQQSLQVLTAQKDAEINRLMTELRRCQAQLLRQPDGGSSVGDQSTQWSKEEEIKQAYKKTDKKLAVITMADMKPPGLIDSRGQKGTAKYKCVCGEKWKMNNSKGGPKTCEGCGRQGIRPYDFIPNPKRMFCDFHCSCGRQWSSGYAWIEWDESENKWVEKFQECRGCNNEVYPSNIRPLRYTGGNASQIPHDSAVCEMCQKYGDCRNLLSAGVEEGEWDDSNTSVRSEASSISGVSDDQNLSDGTPVNSDEETTDDLLSRQLKKLNTK